MVEKSRSRESRESREPKSRHMDEKADKALIKKMVKPADLKKPFKKK